MRLLERYSVLLLDMNGTFMFGEDRFGDNEDFYSTYRSLGGSRLTSVEVTAIIRDCYAGMGRDYADPQCYNDFPSLNAGLRRYTCAAERDLPLLARVFAQHELGTIPPWSATLLRRWSRTHRLALVANIWAPKQLWLEEFNRAGIADVFHAHVFSSDLRSIKPSPRLYDEALRGVGAQPHQALFVGDSLHYDIEGAKRAGIATAWITDAPGRHPSADYVLSSLRELDDCLV